MVLQFLAPAAEAIGATTAGGGGVGGMLQSGLGLATSMFGAGSAADAAKRKRAAEKAAYQAQIKKAKGIMGAGEEAFEKETGAPLEELTAAQEAIKQQASEGQEQARAQTALQLAQQGVRGGQAGTIAARSAGELGRQLTQQIQQQALQEAKERRGYRATQYGEKARMGTQSYLDTKPPVVY